MFRILRCAQPCVAVLVVSLVVLASPGCGGAGGGAGPEGAGQGLVLISFLQASTDNVALNTRLELRFSEALNPTTVNNGSIQIREGDAFGRTVPGDFFVVGATVFFEPVLPSLCDYSDAGFQPDTQYRVQVVGYPEQFAIKNAAGQTLNRTTTWEFHTRLESDPNLFTDQVPGISPFVDSTIPANGAQAVDVAPLGGGPATIELTMNENLNPCSVHASTVLFQMYEIGDPTFPSPFAAPNGNGSGFYAAAPITPGEFTADQAPGDVFTWGADTSTPVGPPQTIPADIQLVQDFTSTRIVITPVFGQFPDNALLVVRLTFNIVDFGGQPLQAFEMSFTTENNDVLPGSYTMEVLGETPFLVGESTADVNTARAPSNIQGYLLFSGDGDNGLVLESPSGPNAAPGCTTPLQGNNSMRDDFDPTVDCLLDTGASNAPCTNSVDGSTAVVYEFATFRVRAGVTVRIVGANPAIILVQGDVTIESNGRLLARGDGGLAKNGTAPQGRGTTGTATTTNAANGGIGVAGGGDGGTCLGGNGAGTARYSGSGTQGYFITGGSVDASVGTTAGPGVGHGNSSIMWGAQSNPNNRNSPSGGGGGHAAAGTPGVENGGGTTPTTLDLPLDGVAGGEYGDATGQLLTPEAGSGGGAAGEIRPFSGNAGRGPGGAGGAGGGFLDLTSSGTIAVLGTIDVAGSRGGNGATQPFAPNYTWQPGSGGGGGGSGGGMRLLTPSDIVVGSTTILTAAGGGGGVGGQSQGNQPPVNPGGVGGQGRICLEDSDSVIAGASGAMILPGEGDDGFYRGTFQATRFQGGGTNSVAVSDLFAIGPLAPSYITPATADFIMGIPDNANALLATGDVVMEIEVQGFPIKPDGTPNTAAGTGYRYAGYVEKSLAATPVFVPGTPPRIVATPGDRPPDNNGDVNGDSITTISPSPYFQLRVRFALPIGLGVLDPGPFIDRWVIRFTSNQ